MRPIQHKADLRTQFDSTLIRFPNTLLTHKLITAIVKLIHVSSEVSDSIVALDSMAAPEPYHSLDSNPRQRFAEFERKVYDLGSSSTLCW